MRNQRLTAICLAVSFPFLALLVSESDDLLFGLLLPPLRATEGDRFVHLQWSPHPHHRGLILSCSSLINEDVTLVDALILFDETEQVRCFAGTPS